MLRRKFIAGLTTAGLTWPLPGQAQEPSVPVIGFIHPESPESTATRMPAFHEGLAEAGYVEGQNLGIEYRWALGRYDLIPGFVAELVERQVSVLVAIANEASFAAKAATRDIPIVAFIGGDPVVLGLADSLARPGGNLTGVDVFLEGSRVGKRLQLLHDMLPSLSRMAVLINPTLFDYHRDVEELHQAGDVLGLTLELFYATSGDEVDAAFAAMEQRGITAVLMMIDPTFDDVLRDRIVAAAVRHRIATQDAGREAVELGGLMSYTPNMPSGYRLTGLYAGRVLAGANPADMPIERLATFELVINLKRAAQLGIIVPTTLLAVADAVIEQ